MYQGLFHNNQYVNTLGDAGVRAIFGKTGNYSYLYPKDL